jgi:hypothetical protein
MSFRTLLPFEITAIDIDSSAIGKIEKIVSKLLGRDSDEVLLASELHIGIILAQQLSLKIPVDKVTHLIINNFSNEIGFNQTSKPTNLKHLDQPQVTSTYHILSVTRLLNIDIQDLMGEMWVDETTHWLKQYAWESDFQPIEYPTLPERIPWIYPSYIHFVICSLDMLGYQLEKTEKIGLKHTLIRWLNEKRWSLSGLSVFFRILDYIDSSFGEESLLKEIELFVLSRFSEGGFSEIDQEKAKGAHKKDDKDEIVNTVSTLSAVHIFDVLNNQEWVELGILDYALTSLERMLTNGDGAAIMIQEFTLKNGTWPLEIAAALGLISHLQDA